MRLVVAVFLLGGCGGGAFELDPWAASMGPAASPAPPSDAGTGAADALVWPPPTCQPETCAELGVHCGIVNAGCGQMVDCGQCQPGMGGVDAANVSTNVANELSPIVEASIPSPSDAAAETIVPTEAGTTLCIQGVGCCAQWGCFTLPGAHGPMLSCCRTFGPQSIGGDCQPVPDGGGC